MINIFEFLVKIETQIQKVNIFVKIYGNKI